MLAGNYFSVDFRYVEVNLVICQGRNDCASKKEIEAFFFPNIAKLQFIYSNSAISFEPSDISQPIKVFADDKIFYPLDIRKQIQTNMYLRECHLSASTNWWSFSQTAFQFHRIDSIRDYD